MEGFATVLLVPAQTTDSPEACPYNQSSKIVRKGVPECAPEKFYLNNTVSFDWHFVGAIHESPDEFHQNIRNDTQVVPYDVSSLKLRRDRLASLALKGRFPHSVGKMSAKPTKGDGSVSGGPHQRWRDLRRSF